MVIFDGMPEKRADFYLASFGQTEGHTEAVILVPAGKRIVVTDGDFERLTMRGHIGEKGLRDLGQV